MYLKSVEIKTTKGEAIEFSFPKMKSKTEISYAHIKCTSKELLKGIFKGIEGVGYSNSNFDVLKGVAIDDLYLVNKDSKVLSLKNVIRLDGDSYNLYLQLLDKNVIVDSVKIALSKDIQLKIHEFFKNGINEVKKVISSMNDRNIGVHICVDYNGNTDTLANNMLCFYIGEFEDSIIDDEYLEKLIEATILKKYGIDNIFTQMLGEAVKSSKYEVNVEKIEHELKSSGGDRVLKVKLSSLLVDKK